MVKSIKRESSLEISIKCRTGVDDKDNYNFLKNFIALTSEAGCKVFFVHARKAHLKGLSPKQNRTIPKLEYEKVYKLKNDFPHLKIILNGGINNLNNFNEHSIMCRCGKPARRISASRGAKPARCTPSGGLDIHFPTN